MLGYNVLKLIYQPDGQKVKIVNGQEINKGL